MSDIRTKLLLGTTIGALAMVFVMAAGVDAFDTKTTSVVQSSGILGHVTVMAVHPDGTVSYAQGDNLIVTGSLEAAQRQLHDRTLSSTAGVFDCMTLGSGAGTGDALNAALTNTGQSCDTNAGITTTGVGIVDIIAAFTIDAADLTAGSVTISEVVLETKDPGFVVLSHVPISDVPAVENTIVTITFEMTLA